MERVTLMAVAQPWQCDQMGHWNVRFYAGAFDDASFQFLGWLAGAGAPAGLGWADVRCETDYRNETVAGTLLTISTGLLRLGSSSVSYHHQMRDSLTGALKAEARTTSVRFDLAARRAVAIEAAARARAAELTVQG